ncbi:MAG: hypothetical protein IK064_05115 [Clostridia bacterium]|nr:hypothetical protein [Clostridia bacterium]
MKLKNITILLIICIMEAALGFGIMTVYSAYFKLPIDGCTSLSVDSHNYFAGEEQQMDEANVQFMERLKAFADEDASLMAVVPLGAAGISVRDNTGWLRSILKSGSIADFEAGKGIIVSSDPGVQIYVKDGVFMRGKLDLRVVGVYDETGMPLQLRNMGFICPLGMANKRAKMTEESGIIIISTTKRTDGLITLIENSGYRERYDAAVLSEPIGLIDCIKSCFTHNDPFSVDMRPTAFGILALVMGIVYGGLMLCRDNLRPLTVRRLFGMPLARMIALYTAVSLLTAVCGLLLFIGASAAAKAFWFYESRHTVRLLAALFVILLSAALTVCAAGVLMLRRSFGKGAAK